MKRSEARKCPKMPNGHHSWIDVSTKDRPSATEFICQACGAQAVE